jgi:hypothetical protein
MRLAHPTPVPSAASATAPTLHQHQRADDTNNAGIANNCNNAANIINTAHTINADAANSDSSSKYLDIFDSGTSPAGPPFQHQQQ